MLPISSGNKKRVIAKGSSHDQHMMETLASAGLEVCILTFHIYMIMYNDITGNRLYCKIFIWLPYGD